MKMPATLHGQDQTEQSCAVVTRGRLLSYLSSRLSLSHYLRSILVLTGGAALGQLIALASSVVLTRLYVPDDFGLLSIFLAIVTITATVGALRYETAIPLPEQDERACELVLLSFACLLSVVCGISFCLWLWGDWLVTVLNADGLRPYLWLAPFGILAIGCYQILSAWAIRQRHYSGIATASVVQALGQALGQILLGLKGLGPLGLISGDVFGRGSGAATLLTRLWGKRSNLIGTTTVRGVGRAAVRYWKFPAISSWAALLNAVGIYLPQILFALFYDLQIVGCLALAQRVLGAPSSLLSNSVSKVYLGEFARLHRDSPHKMTQLFWSTVRSQSAIAASTVLLVGLAAPWVFGWVFGESWELAGWCALLLSVMYVLKMIVFPVGCTLDVLERQDLHIVREVTRLVLSTLAVAMASYAQYGPLGAVALLSAAACVSYILGGCIVWNAISREVEKHEAKVPTAR